MTAIDVGTEMARGSRRLGLLWCGALALLLGGCAGEEIEFAVQADLETPAAAGAGMASGPAIYTDAEGQGFLAGVDGQRGLYIHNLDGTRRHFFALGALGHVDLHGGLQVGGQEQVLLVGSDEEGSRLVTLRYDPASGDFSARRPGYHPLDFAPHGVCVGKVGDGLQVGVTTKAGAYYQFAVSAWGSTLSLEQVREFSTDGAAGACAFDDRTQALYIVQEDGLHHYAAAPGDDDSDLVVEVGEHGLTGPLQGAGIYPKGADGGHLLVSSQGSGSYALFALPEHSFAGRFQIGDGAVDGIAQPAGVGTTATATQRFPRGFLVAQDSAASAAEAEAAAEGQQGQNFKIVDWRRIESGLSGPGE